MSQNTCFVCRFCVLGVPNPSGLARRIVRSRYLNFRRSNTPSVGTPTVSPNYITEILGDTRTILIIRSTQSYKLFLQSRQLFFSDTNFIHNRRKNDPQGPKKKSLERCVSRFCTICDKNQPLNEKKMRKLWQF